MNRLKVIAVALVVGLVVVLGCLATEWYRARRDFLDGCKQEQPIERCEALWRAGGAP